MTLYLSRVSHLHDPARVLSCSQEAGLMVGPPSASASNLGALRLRSSGVPSAATALNLLLQTGGGPYGWANAGSGSGQGASLIWKNSTDTSSQYRGYIDTPFLTRVRFPVTYSASSGIPGTPRELPDGYLGFVIGRTFYRVSPAGVTTTSTILSGSVGGRGDFAILPSGRLIAALPSLHTCYSDDYGVTWTTLASESIGGPTVYALECVGDDLVLVGSYLSLLGTSVFLSRDGGSTWTERDGTNTTINARTCVINGRILVGYYLSAASQMVVRTLVPGGGLGDAAGVGLTNFDAVNALATRDDGTVWAFSWCSSAANGLDMKIAVSTDGGETWEDPVSSARVVDLEAAAYGTNGYDHVSAGCWQGRIVLLARVNSASGSDAAIHLLEFGGWESLTDPRDSEPYSHTYLPIDYPQNVGWPKTDTGAGATVTNQNQLNIISTGANNSTWQSPAAVWTTGTASDIRRLRFRVRVNSGGSTAVDSHRIRAVANDGANQLEVNLRFSTTQVLVRDTAGGATLATISTTMTGWHDFLLVISTATARATLYYKADTATFWTTAFEAGVITPAAGASDRIDFGGTSAIAGNWDIAWIGVGDDGIRLASGYTNPTSLEGRPIPADRDMYVSNMVYVGAFNTAGIKGDSYTLSTTYNYAKEDIWRELRPSRGVRSSADNATWNVVFDAGANALFKGDLAALLGTNFRTATLQFNTSDSWGAPAASVALDATLTSGTVGAGNRGMSYVGPTASPNWRPGQYKSSPGRRYFLEVSSAVYEITNNDEDRLYVDGVNLSAAAGTFRIFSDRMGATTTFKQYRFMRLSLSAQETADNAYRVGTVIFDKLWTPTQLYDYGFVDRVEPRVALYEADSGVQSAARQGARQDVLAIQWPPLAREMNDVEPRLKDFYRSLDGSLQPFLLWRDHSDQESLGLYRFEGVYTGANVWGEGSTALTRVDQLLLRPVS